MMVDLQLLIKNGVQFGHQTWRLSPKMEPFVWGEKNGISLIDVSKTAEQLEKARSFLQDVAARGEPILWAGTKKAAQGVIEDAANKLEQPYVTNRWIGGTLTNYSEVKKSILKLKHYESLLEQPEKMYTKKEYGKFRKTIERIEDNVGGIRNISWPIGALVVVDAKKEQVAVKEAQKVGIPVVALADTNNDPAGIEYVIPGNDDIARAVRVIIDPLVEAVSEGMKQAEAKREQEQQAAEQQKQQKQSTQDDKKVAGQTQAASGNQTSSSSSKTSAKQPQQQEGGSESASTDKEQASADQEERSSDSAAGHEQAEEAATAHSDSSKTQETESAQHDTAENQ